MIDLDGIKKRNAMVKSLEEQTGNTYFQAADIDALIAEIERQRTAHCCEYDGKGPCDFCDG